jgi:two-component system, NtrC family, sensor histidine kinase HydH
LGTNTILRISLLFSFIVCISLLHYFTPLNISMLHDIFQRLYYLPIILASFWFGLKGGIGCSVVISVIYIPHIVMQWEQSPGMEIERYLEILLYNVVGGVTGMLSEREARHRARLENTARELQEQSDKIIRIEDQLRRSERLSTLGAMAAMLAHEIRNPLGSIKGATEILSDDYKPGDRKAEFVQIIIKESDRLNRVVENFLRLGRAPLNPMVSCDIMEELRAVVTLARLEAKGRGVTLQLDGKRLPPIKGDGERLRQAFLNLVLNALQATPAGGQVRIAASVKNPGAGSPGGIEIVVADTGKGIPKDLLETVFIPFFTTREAGTGLGLAITKKIIDAHGGAIAIESEPGKGTVVRVTLPLGQESEPET